MSSDTGSATGAISLITGEFVRPDDERRFMAARWPALAHQVQMTLALGCLFLGLSLVIDHLVVGNEEVIATVAAAKLASLALATGAVAFASRPDRRDLVDALIILIAASLAISNIVQVVGGAASWQTLSLVLGLQILFFTLLVPSRFMLRVGACTILLGGYLVTILIIQGPAQALENIVIQSCFSLLCLECARRVNSSLRNDFIGKSDSWISLRSTTASAAPGENDGNTVAGDAMADEHREAELRLLRRARRESAALAQALLRAIDHGVCVFDKDLRLTTWNHQLLDKLGYDDDFLAPGLSFEAMLQFSAKRGDFGAGEVSALVTERLESCRALVPGGAGTSDRICHVERVLTVHYHQAEGGTLIAVFSEAETPGDRDIPVTGYLPHQSKLAPSEF